MIHSFQKIKNIKGTLTLPGDKSISHRAVMFSSMADGESIIYNISSSEDVRSTINCFRSLGIPIEIDNEAVIINGVGFGGFKKPDSPLNAGNSGTTARLLSGILAMQDFESEITGDLSLSKRPMKRIIDPLTQMGANIFSSDDNTLPLSFKPSSNLKPINYKLPVPSAQVKSSILLAGLHLSDKTCVIESVRTRNHTEKLLGLKVFPEKDGFYIYSSRTEYPDPREYFIPSDISTAAFFIVPALIIQGSELKLYKISLNETRSGILDILIKMGADIKIENRVENSGEEYGDIIIKSSQLVNINIDKFIVPNIIDEIPILSIAGIFAEGKFQIKNAKELRIKESDRISALCSNFRSLGLTVNEYEDGFIIDGKILNSGVSYDSFNDHRIAMTFGILSSIIGDCEVKDFKCVKISNPDFLAQLDSVSVK